MSRIQLRSHSELIVRRSEHLPEPDRVLIASIYADGRSVQDIAALSGIEVRKLRRRVRRLARRLMSDRYIFVVSHRDGWPALRRRLATACVVQGRSMRQAAADCGTTFYNARKQLDAVQALLDSVLSGRTAMERSAPADRDAEAGNVGAR